MKSKRPWKRVAYILRVEHNNGDVKFRTDYRPKYVGSTSGSMVRKEFESLSEAEAHLDAWYAKWWPMQEKSVRTA